jgi:hypothetical protein
MVRNVGIVIHQFFYIKYDNARIIAAGSPETSAQDFYSALALTTSSGNKMMRQTKHEAINLNIN